MPDRVFITNNGQPWKRPERRSPFTLPGWSDPIPLGDRIEVTDQMLRAMLRPLGSESAKSFADFVAGVYNRDGQSEWLTVTVEPGSDSTPEPAPDSAPESTTPSTDTPGEPDASPGKE